MAGATLILETALLLLVAFLAGCVVGAVARRLTLRRPRPTAIPARIAAPAAAAPLVTAPVLAPLFQRSPGPTAAARLAAAAKRPLAAAPEEDERPEPPAPAPLPPSAEPQASAAPAAAVPAGDDAERAARLAVEGDWTPPPRRGPALLPEATAATGDAADIAMAGARSAVAAAQAAARAALAEPPAEPAPEPPAEPAPEPPAEPAPEPPAEPAPEPPAPRARRRFGAPPLLDRPRPGGKDDLTAIRGISPAIAAALNALGVFHFDQLAAWDGKAVVWVDGQLRLKGQIAREKWPEQARKLRRPVRALSPRR